MPAQQNIHDCDIAIHTPGTRDEGPLLDDAGRERNLPLVSVILPTWKEEKYIEKTLQCILGQTYPPYRMEVLIVDGMSPDRTREIVQRYARDNPQIKLLDNPDRLQSAGMNKGILNSRGNIIVRMDAHSEYAPDYIRNCVETLRRTGADNVGGPQRPRARTFFQKMVSVALSSNLGTGGAMFRQEGKDGYVDTVFPGAFKREALQRVGLFDPGAITNEDAEINQRIIEAGGKIYLNSAIECYYYPRESLKSLFVQYFKYGRGRARTFLKHGSLLRLSSFMPFCFVFGMLGFFGLGAYMPIFNTIAIAGLLFYAGCLLGESLRLAVRHRWQCLFYLPVIFAATHFAHAFGVFWGFLYYTYNPDWRTLAPPKLA